MAYDSGGVTTSTITVPLVTALGVGLASSIKGRDPMLDGFGLIAFASVFPIMSVLAYAMAVSAIARLRGEGLKPEKTFLGLELTAMRDVLLFMVAETSAREILERIRDAGRFETDPGAGVAFQIAIEDAVGMGTQLPTLMKAVEEEI